MSPTIDDEDIQIVAEGSGIGDISRSFFYNHAPAVIEENPSGFSLLLFENNRWQSFFSYTQAFPGNMGVFFIESPDYFSMLLQGMPHSWKMADRHPSAGP